MSVRKLVKAKRAAATATVDSTARPVLPPGPAPLPVEPLAPPLDGRAEAREAFVRDALGDAPPPVDSAPLPSGNSAPPPSPESVTPEQLAATGAELLDTALQLVGPMAVGGTKKTWALDAQEKELLAKTGRPVIEKHLTTQLSIEWVFVLSVATVTLPKAAAAIAELEKEQRERRERQVNAPPVPPPQPAGPPKKPTDW